MKRSKYAEWAKGVTGQPPAVILSYDPPPRCPRCGYVMCEQFDERPLNAVATLATPNGQYVCRAIGCVPAPAAPPPGGRDV